jgi:hypothetical protein
LQRRYWRVQIVAKGRLNTAMRCLRKRRQASVQGDTMGRGWTAGREVTAVVDMIGYLNEIRGSSQP